MDERKKKGTRWLWLVATLLLLGMLVSLAGETNPVVAHDDPPDEFPTWGPRPCVYEVEECDLANTTCTANDMRVSRLNLNDVINYCQLDPEGFGTFEFRVEFIGGSQERYNPSVYIALDGGDALTGLCYKDWLEPISKDAVDIFGGFGPFWDLNDDVCGDVKQGELNVKIIGPVTLDCTKLREDNNISVFLGWANNKNEDCSLTNACPGTPSKCFYDPNVPFDVTLRQVDLAITKTATRLDADNQIPEDGLFDYDLVVRNTGEFDPGFLPDEEVCWPSTGYRVTDELPQWLKIQDSWLPFREFDIVTGELMVECDTEPNESLPCWSEANPDGCNGYGDILTCRSFRGLECGQSAPAITIPVQLWMDRESDPSGPPFDNLNILPDLIENEACVAGNEFDWYLDNNCDLEEVTEVTITEFTATSNKQEIVVEWKTSNEVGNLGFKLYRGTNPLGSDKIMIAGFESTVSSGGAEYRFVDPMGGRMGLRPNVIYYYWLEDIPSSGDSEGWGPESAFLLLGRYGK